MVERGIGPLARTHYRLIETSQRSRRRPRQRHRLRPRLRLRLRLRLQLRGRSATKHLIARLLLKFLRAALPPSAEPCISECYLYLRVGLSGTGTCWARYQSIIARLENRLGRRSLEHVSSSGRAAPAALQVHLTHTRSSNSSSRQLHFSWGPSPTEPRAIPLAHGTGLQPLTLPDTFAELLSRRVAGRLFGFYNSHHILLGFFWVSGLRFASNILDAETMSASKRLDALYLSDTTAHSMFEFVRNQIRVRTRFVHVEPIRGSAADCAVLVGCCRGESLLRWCFSTRVVGCHTRKIKYSASGAKNQGWFQSDKILQKFRNFWNFHILLAFFQV